MLFISYLTERSEVRETRRDPLIVCMTPPGQKRGGADRVVFCHFLFRSGKVGCCAVTITHPADTNFLTSLYCILGKITLGIDLYFV
jgi:hypothetical protein